MEKDILHQPTLCVPSSMLGCGSQCPDGQTELKASGVEDGDRGRLEDAPLARTGKDRGSARSPRSGPRGRGTPNLMQLLSAVSWHTYLIPALIRS